MELASSAELIAEVDVSVKGPASGKLHQLQASSDNSTSVIQGDSASPLNEHDKSLQSASQNNVTQHGFCTNVLPDYTFDPTFTIDENFIAWSLIYSRLSVSKRGNMAAIIVEARRDEDHSHTNPPAVVTHSNNFPLAAPITRNGKHAEIHAEARAIALAAKEGKALDGSTIYITFPPCSACFPLIAASGIKRCVYRRWQLSEEVFLQAVDADVEIVEFTDFDQDERLKAVADQWWIKRGDEKDSCRVRSESWWAVNDKRLQEVTSLAKERGLLANREAMQVQRKARKRSKAAASQSSEATGNSRALDESADNDNKSPEQPPTKKQNTQE
jgi:deoxycytidylate deaminase